MTADDGTVLRLTDRLPCGTVVADLLDPAIDKTPAGRHSDGCRHCQGALTRLRGRWAPVAAAAREPAPVPPGLVARVSRAIRADHGSAHALRVTGPGGGLFLAPRVVADLVRRAAAGVADMRAIGAHYDGDRVRMDVHARLGAPIPAAAARVRRQVRSALLVHLGTEGPPVDIAVTALFVAAEPPDAGVRAVTG